MQLCELAMNLLKSNTNPLFLRSSFLLRLRRFSSLGSVGGGVPSGDTIIPGKTKYLSFFCDQKGLNYQRLNYGGQVAVLFPQPHIALKIHIDNRVIRIEPLLSFTFGIALRQRV